MLNVLYNKKKVYELEKYKNLMKKLIQAFCRKVNLEETLYQTICREIRKEIEFHIINTELFFKKISICN